MEKKIILPANNMLLAIDNIANTMKAPLEWLRAYYSNCLDKEINMRQTWLIIRTQAAFLLTVFTVCPLIVRAALALWFLVSLLQCRREL